MSPPTPRAAADRYVLCVNGRDLRSLVELFAPDAELLDPLGATHRGRGAIEAFYRDLVFASPIELREVRAVASRRDCLLELEGLVDGDVAVRLVDVFTTDPAGRIERLAVYTRPLAPS